MIRLSSLTLCVLIAASTTAFAYEGPQEQALDKSLAQMQGQDSTANPATITAAPIAPAPQEVPPAKPNPHEGVNERRMDEGLQPLGGDDPAGDAMVRKLNGGQ